MIKRFEMVCHTLDQQWREFFMQEKYDGEYVHYDDHAKAQEKLIDLLQEAQGIIAFACVHEADKDWHDRASAFKNLMKEFE